MSPTTTSIASILAKYARCASDRVDDDTTLRSLDIDRLDLPMIALDIEDTFEVDICAYDWIADATTVGALVELTANAIATKVENQRIRLSSPRVRRSWLSTEAEQRH